MKRTALAALLAAAAAAGLHAETPRWLRNVAISPDGSTIAFTYKGDIFTVPAAGGKATQMTTNPAYDTTPVWSPDGSIIAFQSFRDGSADIFTMPAKGGTPVKITTSSREEAPLTFLDNATLLYLSNDMPSAKTSRGFGPQTYTVDVTVPNARPQQYLSLPMKQASANAKGVFSMPTARVWRISGESTSVPPAHLTSG